MLERARRSTVVQVLAGAAMVGIVLFLMLPSLRGYQAAGEIRAYRARVIGDLRDAAQTARVQNQQLNFFVNDNGGRGGGSLEILEQNGSVFTTLVIPNTMHVHAGCYRGTFEPHGNVRLPLPCPNPGPTLALLCFESGTPAAPAGLTAAVVIDTGQVLSLTQRRC